MLKNTDTTYSSFSKFLHWTIFLLVAIMLGAGFFLDDIPHGAFRTFVITLHKSIGITILFLMLIRLIWALMNTKPKLPPQTHLWEKISEHTVHTLLYIILIAMPLSGWIMSSAAGKPPNFFWLVQLPLPVPHSSELSDFGFAIHQYLAWTIIILVSIHILAALKHHFINKDNILKRMMPTK
ncbi:MAG: cytochrome b [Gammaproteobacteria bacterium]